MILQFCLAIQFLKKKGMLLAQKPPAAQGDTEQPY